MPIRTPAVKKPVVTIKVELPPMSAADAMSTASEIANAAALVHRNTRVKAVAVTT